MRCSLKIFPFPHLSSSLTLWQVGTDSAAPHEEKGIPARSLSHRTRRMPALSDPGSSQITAPRSVLWWPCLASALPMAVQPLTRRSSRTTPSSLRSCDEAGFSVAKATHMHGLQLDAQVVPRHHPVPKLIGAHARLVLPWVDFAFLRKQEVAQHLALDWTTPIGCCCGRLSAEEKVVACSATG